MKKRILCLFLMATFLVGCNELTAVPTTAPTAPDATSPTGAPIDPDFSQTQDEMFSNRDRDTSYDPNKAISIQFDGDSAASTSNTVAINGSTVTLTSEATYILTGTLNDGTVVIDAGDQDKLQLVLSGAHITSSVSAAICVKNADKVFVTLADGTENTLSNGGSFTDADDSAIDGALFSRQDLTLNGSGSLSIASPAGHGIVCKDDLVITGGSYTINAASHGIDANDSVRIGGGSLTMDTGKDGIHAENNDDGNLGFVYISAGTLVLETEGDGISAGAFGQFEGGSVEILAGGGYENSSKTHSDGYGDFMGGGPGGMGPGGRPRTASADADSTSMKGIKAAGDLLFNGGAFDINSADDSIHADVSVAINGHSFIIRSGDDGIHADEDLTITAGTVQIENAYEGLEATNIAVTGGDIELKSSDDGLNAAGGNDNSGMGGMRPGDDHFGSPGNGSIRISGGTLHINASGDGMDANGTIEITGGYTVISGPTRGDTATMDYDVSGTISGGTFIGTGAASVMAQTFSDSEQGVISVNVGTAAAGTEIVLTDGDGNVVISYTPALEYNIVILSSPDMVKGETYTITVGANSGEFTAV